MCLVLFTLTILLLRGLRLLLSTDPFGMQSRDGFVCFFYTYPMAVEPALQPATSPARIYHVPKSTALVGANVVESQLSLWDTIVKKKISMMAEDQGANGGAKFHSPGICRDPNCEVQILLDDQSRLYACRHTLINLSDYFHKLFTSEFKEKDKREVEIHDVDQSSMVMFLEWASNPCKTCNPPRFDDGTLNSMMFLADRFMCEKLEHDILHQLNTDEMFKNPPETKLELLITADKYRGSSTAMLEACIKLCVDLSPEKVAELHGKIGNGTLATLYAMVARGLSDRTVQLASLYHYCQGTSCLWRGSEWKNDVRLLCRTSSPRTS